MTREDFLALCDKFRSPHLWKVEDGNGLCATSHKAIMDNLMVFHRQNFRVIGRLDVKGPDLIKGIHMEGLRVVGVPNELAKKYYQSGVDELLYIDLVASLYGRSNLADIVSATIDDVFVPITWRVG